MDWIKCVMHSSTSKDDIGRKLFSTLTSSRSTDESNFRSFATSEVGSGVSFVNERSVLAINFTTCTRAHALAASGDDCGSTISASMFLLVSMASGEGAHLCHVR